MVSVATSSWLQSWNQPTSNIVQHPPVVYDEVPLNNINVSSFGNSQSYSSQHSRPNNFLPYLLSLSLLNGEQPTDSVVPVEITGPLTTVYHWNEFDFVYPSEQQRKEAILYEDFIPKSVLPLGMDVYKDRIFITLPIWRPGTPATLAVVPKRSREKSPALTPYPSWDWHRTGSCDGLISVFRAQVDSCGRLWVLDSGQLYVTENAQQICPPKILIFDLRTDKLLTRYVLPDELVKKDGLFANILVDIRDGDCERAHAYLTDIWRFGLVVFSLEKIRGWLVTNHFFYSDPLSAEYRLHHLDFHWTDGILGMGLSPYDKYRPDRTLYFNPMTSSREFYVATSVIRNETGWSEAKNAFKILGQSRGPSGQVASSAMDRNGILFYNLITRDSIGCWDSRKPYKRPNLGVVAKSTKTLVFPNDIKIDEERRQSLWVLTNELPFYLYEPQNDNITNVRILTAYTDEAIKNTICDPHVGTYDTYVPFSSEDDCY